MKHLFIYLSIFLLFTGCKKNENNKKTPETEISAQVNKLYALDRSGKLFPLPKDLFSADLEKLLNESQKVSEADAEKIKKSDHPTDKPMMLESSIMTDLQDANTGFSIKKVNIKANTAEAFTEFQYDKSKLEIQVLLVNQDGWKIENIIYNKDPNANLKTRLKHFITFP